MTPEKYQLLWEIMDRERFELDFIDGRPTMFGNFSAIKMNKAQMEYYLLYCKNTTAKKQKLRKEVGWFKYLFVCVPKLMRSFNSYYYHRI